MRAVFVIGVAINVVFNVSGIFPEFEKLEICYAQFFLINALRSRHC